MGAVKKKKSLSSSANFGLDVLPCHVKGSLLHITLRKKPRIDSALFLSQYIGPIRAGAC